MGTGRLSIDLSAVVANWQALSALARVDSAPVVKADAYGLGLAPVARALAKAGARTFFVAYAEEGGALRRALGPGPQINVLSTWKATPAPSPRASSRRC
jgi:alanine racemase